MNSKKLPDFSLIAGILHQTSFPVTAINFFSNVNWIINRPFARKTTEKNNNSIKQQYKLRIQTNLKFALV